MKIAMRQVGNTLVELTVALAITGIVAVPLTGIMSQQLSVPGKIFRRVTTDQQELKSNLMLAEDAAKAQSFFAVEEPLDYGTLSWFELTGDSPVAVSARYFWDPINQAVVRMLTIGGVEATSYLVVANIAKYSDVSFQHIAPSWQFDPVTKSWSYTEGKLEVAITQTREAGTGADELISTVRLVTDFRPQIDLPAPLPGRLAPPAPALNQVAFRVSGDPTLTSGKLHGGGGRELFFNDALYLDVDGAGAPKTIVWEATSEPIDYASITSITVEFTGQVDKAGVTQEFFIYNPGDPDNTGGGYDPLPDVTTLYTSPNLDQTVKFEFSDLDVGYVDSLGRKVAKVKMRATLTGKFKHRADQLVFKVTGEPSPNFSRDYLVEADPSLKAGKFNSGDFNSLVDDDSDYYTAEELGGVVQWSVVTEPITLEPISSVEVVFTGIATKGAPEQEIFVFNPANGGDGYAALPDSRITYAATNTDTTVSFFLSEEDLAYVNALFPKEVRIRVKATDSTDKFRLEAGQLIFRVRQ